MAQSYVYDAFKVVHQAALSSKGITSGNLADTTSLFGCDTLIVDTLTNPMTIVIQFNGTCSNNNNDRYGSITASFSGKYDALGTSVNISFNNYRYGGYPITGSINYSFSGVISSLPTYAISVSNFSIENSKERLLSVSGNQTLKITAGEMTASVNDDTYIITGSASGRAFEGNDFSAIIDNSLDLAGNCKWISSGITTVSPENKQPRILDFGSGCDDKASAKIYGLNYEITIP
jgi:hypothetical protein